MRLWSICIPVFKQFFLFQKKRCVGIKRVDRANKDVEQIDCVSMNLQGSERHLYLTVLEVS